MRDIISMACGTCQRRNYCDDEEPAHASRPDGAEEVLQVVPEAHAAQGDEVARDDGVQGCSSNG